MRMDSLSSKTSNNQGDEGDVDPGFSDDEEEYEELDNFNEVLDKALNNKPPLHQNKNEIPPQ